MGALLSTYNGVGLCAPSFTYNTMLLAALPRAIAHRHEATQECLGSRLLAADSLLSIISPPQSRCGPGEKKR